MAAGSQAEGVPAPGAGAEWSEFDIGVAHPARVYDYWLGGKDNFAADRAVADQIIAQLPAVQASPARPDAPRGRLRLNGRRERRRRSGRGTAR